MTGAVFGREAMFGDFVQFCLGVVVTVVIAVNPLLLAFAAPSVLLQRRFVMHAQLLSRTRIDAKTRLLNASTWECQANVEVARAGRTRTPLAIALVDIDHFKNVNDTDGHLAGDEVLQAVTATFRDHLREYDTAGRFGGDEFAILLPHAARDDAYGIAERLRAHIADLQIPVRSRPGAPGVEVTISIGVATFDGRVPRALSDLLAAADAALYQAKRTGRNRVRVVTDIGAYPGRARDAGGVPHIGPAGVGAAGVGAASAGPGGAGPAALDPAALGPPAVGRPASSKGQDGGKRAGVCATHAMVGATAGLGWRSCVVSAGPHDADAADAHRDQRNAQADKRDPRYGAGPAR